MKEQIVYYSTESSDLFNLEMAGITYPDIKYRINRTNAEFYVFEYIIKGTGTVIHNQQAQTVQAGDVYILKRGADHCYYPSRQDPWEKVWFNVHGSLLDQLISFYGLHQTVYRDCNAHSLFQDLLSVTRRGNTASSIQQQCAVKVHEIAAFIASYSHTELQTDADTLQIYLDRNINQNISLEDMAKLLYKSRSQTIRLFKESFGITPYQYLIRQRIKTAKMFLRNTSMSIKEIAAELQFADEHYFSNTFKAHVGISPKRYRQQRTAHSAF